MKEIKLEDISEILLRLLSRPKHYHGIVEIKFYNGEIKNIKATDSFDIEYLKEKTLIIEKGNKEMLIKHGTSNKKDKESSKIISEVEIEDEKIVKESKIIKKEKNEKSK